MKVLLINGSPRANGNTSIALAEVASTLEAEGIETITVNIGNQPVRGCVACGACHVKRGKCAFSDSLYDQLHAILAEGVDGFGKKDNNKFIIQAVGHSMEPRINDGDYCLFQRYQGGSREGKIILAEHHGSVDSEYEGSYSIKEYHSTKKYNEFGEWAHESIELHPLNRSYDPIILSPDDIEEFCIIGEFVKVIHLRL